MFVMDQSDTYTWPVKVEYPDEGRKKKQTFDGEFKRLAEPRIEAIREMLRNNEPISDVEIAKEILVGWSGVNDGSGNEVVFSQLQLEKMLKIPLVASFVVRAWFESLSETKAKN